MQLALRNYYSECSLHNIYYYSQESCKHHDFFFLLSGSWKLYQVCQLQRWTVLCVSLSPRRARGGWHACVEICRWDESVPAMPQKLHSRVKALFSLPENWLYISTMLQTFVCQNVDAEMYSKPEGSFIIGTDSRVRLAFNMKQFLLRLMMKLDNWEILRTILGLLHFCLFTTAQICFTVLLQTFPKHTVF